MPHQLASAVGLYLLWVTATYVLEGCPRTLLRPEAVGLRALYALLANLLIGLLLAGGLLRHLIRSGPLTAQEAGFRSPRHAVLASGAGVLLGAALLLGHGVLFYPPVVLLNIFAQVFPVSVAEVVVCWAVLGATATAWLQHRGIAGARLFGALVASLLFGLYHFAHSPPFNRVGMVVFLTGIGLGTSLFFFVSRDLYGTTVFHTCLGLFGVVQALSAARRLGVYTGLAWPVLITATMAGVLLVFIHRRWLSSASVHG